MIKTMTKKTGLEDLQLLIDEANRIFKGKEREAAAIREKIYSSFPELERVKETTEDGATWIVLLFLALTFLLDKISTHRITIGYEEIEKILKQALGDKCGFLILDLQKDIPYRKEVLQFLKEDKTNLERYVRQGIYDCDKFARHLWGRLAMGPLAIDELREGTKAWARTSFGISWSQIHMYNVLIDQPEKDIKVVNYVEPQNDALLDPAELKNVRVPCIKKVFDGEEYWIPEWEAFSLVSSATRLEPVAIEVNATNILDSSIKLKRDFPMPFAKLTTEQKKEGREKIDLNPYETIGVMM